MRRMPPKGKKFIAVLCFVALLFILDFVSTHIKIQHMPKFETPQEVAEYLYQGEPKEIIWGQDSCFIFNRFFDRTAEYTISPCIDGKYEIRTAIQSNLIIGKLILIQYIDFLQVKDSNDQYIVVLGTGYPSEINVIDNKGTDFHLFFYEEQVEGTGLAPYFWAVGYLDSEDLSFYTVTVNDSNTSESLSVE